MNTVVAATMHNIQPGADDNIKDFTAINMWYQRLDERYNFSLGEAILPLMNSDRVKESKALKAPFMRPTNKMANNTQCTAITSVNGKY